MGGHGDYSFKQSDQGKEIQASGSRSDRSRTREFTGPQVSGGFNSGEESLRGVARRVLSNTGRREVATYPNPSSSEGDEQSYRETRNDVAQYGSTSVRSMSSVNEWVKEENRYIWDPQDKEYKLHPDHVKEDDSYNPHSTFSSHVDYYPYPPTSSYVDYLYDHESNSPTSVGSEGSGPSYGFRSDKATIDSDDADDTNVRLERPKSNYNRVNPFGRNDRQTRHEKPRRSEMYPRNTNS